MSQLHVRSLVRLVLPLVLVLLLRAQAAAAGGRDPYTDQFNIADCAFADTGRNDFFVLDPGHQLVLAGDEHKDHVDLTITVLADTLVVDGVSTRVVEERELVNGALVEVSRNYFARCLHTNDIYYFGEDVDIYENGDIVGHEGAWRAGVAGARAGIIMPGSYLLGARYHQEVAPGVALDRAENTAMGLAVTVPAGTFAGSVEVMETTPLERGTSRKVYAPDVGLIVDGSVELVSWTD